MPYCRYWYKYRRAWYVYSFPPPAEWTCRVYPFQHGTCRMYPRPSFAVWTCRVVHVFINAGMPDCLASDQSGTGMIRYRTEIQDVGMPMPPASALMPMPSYASSLFPNFFLIPFSYSLAPHLFLLLSLSFSPSPCIPFLINIL